VGSYIYYMATQGFSHIVSFLLPNFIATLVFAFYCISSIRFLQNAGKSINRDLLVITLLIQSLLLDMGGVVFRNMYFPAYIFHMNLRELNDSFFEYSHYTVKIV